MGPNIWIQSLQSRKDKIWYQLGQATAEYRRYHQPFLWLADFSKHFVDFLDNQYKVGLQHFREGFFSWINKKHGQDESFKSWLALYNGTDFRQVVAAHCRFLWNQARDLDYSAFEEHPISAEVHPGHLDQIKQQPSLENSTLVTPFVYECFKHLSWGRFLEPRTPYPKVTKVWLDEKIGSRETVHEDLIGPNSTGSGLLLDIKVGDVVGVPKDEHTVWKSTTDLWFAYVQDLRTDTKGRKFLKVIWLYTPSDTTCSTGRYPVVNELFFSDNCNCEDGVLRLDEVICKISVAYHHQPGASDAEYIIRQKFTYEDTFVTLKDSDFRCVHQNESTKTVVEELMEEYRVGDTILALDIAEDQNLLEPAEIVAFDQSGLSDRISVRRLPRRKRDFGDLDARPNELVYTDEILSIPANAVDRRCHLRFYTTDALESKDIPTPYNRDGTADAYYITCQVQLGSQKLEPLRIPFPKTLIQGFDPNSQPLKDILNGMDLFCGGGNFGRGLEEGCAIRNKWAVDWNASAMHTYSANLRESDNTQLFNGSVNDYLAQAMEGSTTKEIAKVGEVDFISAGSPCQGYSVANMARTSDKALKYCSLTASVAAFIDLYRPKYALLENVTHMVRYNEKNPQENVFSQMLCTFVSMGYQVRTFHLDAWSFGSPQSRSRLFISIAAQGLSLPRCPLLSHSHVPKTKQRSIGRAANGLAFGLRQFNMTPFDYVTAYEATRDLPYLGDACDSACIPYPDHRTSRTETTTMRALVSQVPRSPYGQAFVDAVLRGRMGKPQIEIQSQSCGATSCGSVPSKAWTRLKPYGLFPTITTAIRPQDGRSGPTVHWDENRIMTVMEARRAQGFPDEEVLIGSPANQWKIIGNSVARQVALVLGMSLRAAWLANLTTATCDTTPHHPYPTPPIKTSLNSPTSHPVKHPPPEEVIDISDTDQEPDSSHQIRSELQASIHHRQVSTPQPRLSSSVALKHVSTTITNHTNHSETRLTQDTSTMHKVTATHTSSTAQLKTPTRQPRPAVQKPKRGHRDLLGSTKDKKDVGAVVQIRGSQHSPIKIED